MIPRLLAISAASKGLAMVLLVDGALIDWRISDLSAKSVEAARQSVRAWIKELQPMIVVTERPDTATHKGHYAKTLLAAMGEEAARGPALHVAVTRERRFSNLYLEAEDCGARYPEVAPWVPQKRKFQDHEPRSTLLFEALVLAESVLWSDATKLAAALG